MISNKNISITVKFFATLRVYGPDKEILRIPEKSKVAVLFDKYGIPQDARRTVILINGSPHKDLNTVLEDGDIVSIFPPIGGG
ncbi:MAG: MoaD/ThiS family protein [Promethearchaeota archaeon]|jgi:molybdopterin converting factor small subunit